MTMRLPLLLAAALLAVLVLGAGAQASSTKHCSGYYFEQQYKHVTSITIKGGTCTTAHKVVAAYERAITLSSGPGAKPGGGTCFGAHSFGHCGVTADGRKYDCNRPTGPGLTIPATCTRNSLSIHFKG